MERLPFPSEVADANRANARAALEEAIANVLDALYGDYGMQGATHDGSVSARAHRYLCTCLSMWKLPSLAGVDEEQLTVLADGLTKMGSSDIHPHRLSCAIARAEHLSAAGI